MINFADIVDAILHPNEYTELGDASERFLYRALIKLGVPKNQIFRNVYIPTDNGKLTEIDLLVVCKKGIFIIENKALNGNIYGDGLQDKWIQYVGKKKSYFLSPVVQNQYHKKCLEKYINKCVPITTFITHAECGKWKVKNLKPNDHFLKRLREFLGVYQNLPDALEMKKYYKKLCEDFASKSRQTL